MNTSRSVESSTPRIKTTRVWLGKTLQTGWQLLSHVVSKDMQVALNTMRRINGPHCNAASLPRGELSFYERKGARDYVWVQWSAQHDTFNGGEWEDLPAKQILSDLVAHGMQLVNCDMFRIEASEGCSRGHFCVWAVQVDAPLTFISAL